VLAYRKKAELSAASHLLCHQIQSAGGFQNQPDFFGHAIIQGMQQQTQMACRPRAKGQNCRPDRQQCA
jgi:hypothetical protein